MAAVVGALLNVRCRGIPVPRGDAHLLTDLRSAAAAVECIAGTLAMSAETWAEPRGTARRLSTPVQLGEDACVGECVVEVQLEVGAAHHHQRKRRQRSDVAATRRGAPNPPRRKRGGASSAQVGACAHGARGAPAQPLAPTQLEQKWLEPSRGTRMPIKPCGKPHSRLRCQIWAISRNTRRPPSEPRGELPWPDPQSCSQPLPLGA